MAAFYRLLPVLGFTIAFLNIGRQVAVLPSCLLVSFTCLAHSDHQVAELPWLQGQLASP